jgi:flagellar protein FlgJ
MKPADFIAALTPGAVASAKATGVPASVTIAQAALESGWGTSGLCALGCNLFGIKADPAWKGPVCEMPTTEYIKGKPVSVLAKWRKYATWADCIADRSAFLRTNPRYRLAFTGKRTGEDFARCIAAAGYATDPRYADKVVALIRQYKLDQLDGNKSP